MTLLFATLSQPPGLYQRPKRKRAHPEQSLQRGVVTLLSVALGGVAWFSHFPSGGGGEMRGKILKGMGLKPGVPDILIIDGGRCYWLELKAPKGTITDNQKQCHAALGRAGCGIAIIRSIDDVLPALKKWGVALNGNVYVPRDESAGDGRGLR